MDEMNYSGEYVGPVVLDPVAERANALIALAEAIDKSKDGCAKSIMRKYMEKIYASIRLPSGADVVQLGVVEGDKK